MAIDLLVFMAHLADGSRKVVQISEITGMELDNILLNDLFKLEPRKASSGISSSLLPTGAIPRFYEQLRAQGVEPPMQFFKN